MLRKRRFEAHFFFGARVNETQTIGMKELAILIKLFIGVPIERIADDRMMDIFHMHADLMGSSSEETARNQGAVRSMIPLFNMEISNGFLAI